MSRASGGIEGVQGGVPQASRRLFTFPDAVFSYECRGCGACCKGLGIGVDAARGELERLATWYPQIESFARLRGSTWTVFNPRDRCWFLDDEGWCRVEREHGRDAKPASCRLFPFNRVFRVGAWLVVDYNAVICPMRALEPSATDDAVGLSGRVRHDGVLAEIAAIEDAGVVGTRLPLGAGDDADALLGAEQEIAVACFAAAATALGSPGAPAAQVEAVGAAQRAATARCPGPVLAPAAAVEALGSLLGEAPRLPGATTLRHALLATPSLRFNELFGPRLWQGRARTRSALPGMWRTWLHLLAAGESLAGRALTLQEVTSVWGEVAALGYLAAHWQSAPSLPSGPLEVPGEGAARGRVLRFARACAANRAAQRPLGELAAPLLEGDSVRERVATVRLLEGLLRSLSFEAPVEPAPAPPPAPTSRTARKKRPPHRP